MGFFEDRFSLDLKSKTEENNIAVFGCVRISVLTSRLIRVEQKANRFLDLPTQSVWYRSFESPDFSAEIKNGKIIVKTGDCTFLIGKNGKLLKVITKEGKSVTDFKSGNLKGTKRTLDMTYGKVKLGRGILSKNGVALLDDKKSLVINSDGTLAPFSRKKDYYVFAYSRNYREALCDFFRLTGNTPLLPRYTLGNWWSRYKAYTQQEYLDLMARFKKENIPLSVATIDMDWHWVDVVKKFGKSAKNSSFPKNPSELCQGWTGYSWNTDLFPDYKEFLKKLKEMKLHITLNVHPSMGVRWFEDSYKDFAKFMGIDPNSKKQIKFDMTDKHFVEAYFKLLHYGYEKDGVDFWWIDWQQGKKSKIKGLDPLWALNHYHYLDSTKSKNKGVILSRFAGAGSHRYPLGFSGDTAIYWSCLRFQPYFTATASNIGYGWWSHDIGGHRGGRHNDELYLRWLQFGIFSPVNRLHSTKNKPLGKEPWNYSAEVNSLAVKAMQFRKRLIPYIYSANYICHNFGKMLIEPMYYQYPYEEKAYKYKNQYFFGSELIVAPITRKTDSRTETAFTEVWLPEGEYTDIFTNRIYKGSREIKMFRSLDSIPVLAKSGAIIPLDCNLTDNETALPEALEVLVFNGNNTYKLYEDNNDSEDEEYKLFVTTFEVKDISKKLTFTVSCEGEPLVNNRKYILSFRNIKSCDKITVNGCEFTVDENKDYLSLTAKNCKSEFFVELEEYKKL